MIHHGVIQWMQAFDIGMNCSSGISLADMFVWLGFFKFEELFFMHFFLSEKFLDFPF